VSDNVLRSSRAPRLLAAALLASALCALPAAASAAATRAPIAHVARSPQQAQAHAERELQRRALREQRSAARQARRATRAAEREARHATRAAERAARESAGAAGGHDEAPTPEAPNDGAEGRPAAPDLAHPCSLTADSSAHQVSAGEAVTISGKLSCQPGVDAGGQEVSVSQRGSVLATSGTDVAGSATTQADGSFQLQSSQLEGRSVFIARTGTARHQARVVVTVTGAITLQGPSATAPLAMSAARTSGGPTRTVFTGTVEPAEAGRQVALKVRYSGGESRTVAFTRTDAQGHFAFSHRFRFAGDVSVIATARPRGTVSAQSVALTYAIAQAQNPELTINDSVQQAPASPAGPPVGQPVTISGVAAGQPNQTVTLLVRTSTGRFASSATTQTDATGAYSFTVAPTQTTVYAVKCARILSALVRREVS
jgi:hypothetical protein